MSTNPWDTACASRIKRRTSDKKSASVFAIDQLCSLHSGKHMGAERRAHTPRQGLLQFKLTPYPSRRKLVVAARASPNRFVATGAVNAGMVAFGRSPAVPSKGGAKPPLGAAKAALRHDVLSTRYGFKDGDNTRRGRLPSTCDLDHAGIGPTCASLRLENLRRDFQAAHPGLESRICERPGVFSGHAARGPDRASWW
jgi:hypothetical protein